MPKIDYARYERTLEELAGTGLNQNQAEAVAQAYAVDFLHLIKGPPGTCKTLVLAHLARLLAEDGRRVLVTGLTHRASHNAFQQDLFGLWLHSARTKSVNPRMGLPRLWGAP